MLLLLCPILLSREVFFAIYPNVHFGCGNATTNDSRNFQPSANIQRRHGVFQHFWRNSGVNKRAHEHVAAHAGKTFKIGNTHRIEFFTTEDTEITEERKEE